MNITLRNKFLSRPRYSRYLSATAHNPLRASRLYHANIRLAEAFHPVLSQFEVILRNCLNRILTDHFSDPDWIINQKSGFMRHPSLRNAHYFLCASIQKTELKLSRRATVVTGGKIIADQTFGFWLSFFLAHHYTLVGGKPIQIFPYKPTSENRATIYGKLNDIRNFRNRVSHCEPICFEGRSIDCSYALHIRSELYDLIRWIDPDLAPFFESFDNIQRRTEEIANI